MRFESDSRTRRMLLGLLCSFGFSVLGSGVCAAPNEAGKSKSDPATARATREKPFINSLGMKFVPVPILGGPTGGQRVLFSMWDTRVQDYAAYATEDPNVNMEWKDVEHKGEQQRPPHPVVRISWEDAKAFCAWLTKKERATGELGPHEEYRLPGDHEWSCAAGIGEREDADATPKAKDQKVADAFPWGSDWPPEVGAGNYAPALKVDDFAFTSPVGSFAANRRGLYDMGGNVWQWCEDEYEPGSGSRALRGASWLDVVRDVLVSSCRLNYRPGGRSGSIGFRCVLGASSP